MKPSLPVLLSINGGFVDSAGFLALHGLFTSHVTGNFVTLGAALVHGTSGAVAKVLALPVFCGVVFATRLLSAHLPSEGRWSGLRVLLAVKLLLLTLGSYLAIRLGPFHSGDGWQALVTGMTLVAAMAIQNAIHRIHMSGTSPTTIMTGNTTQLMIDLADARRRLTAEANRMLHARLTRLSASVAAFAVGCATAALIYAYEGDWCFVVPPVIALYTLMLSETSMAAPPAKPAAAPLPAQQ